MAAIPIWFGREERQLFGWIHLPERAVAGFVLCPPIGIEGSPGYRGLTVIAERLEAMGHVVLRFDYTGTGDSAGDLGDVPSVSTWDGDIKTAIDLVRRTGVSHVGLVGLRVGALLAANVLGSAAVDALALWDPCMTGRRFLREQQVLGAVVAGRDQALDSQRDDAVDIPSIYLPGELAASLADVDIAAAADDFPAQVLILTRPDRPVAMSFAEQVDKVHVEWAEAPDQYAFFESHVPFMPTSTIDKIVSWCGHVFDGSQADAVVPAAPPGAWTSAIVAHSPGGSSVVEQPVVIEPHGLFGIISECEAGVPGLVKRGPTPLVLLLNLGGDRRTGPSRMWVDLARCWAAKGVRVLRLDIGGLGDSAASPGVPRYLVFPPSGIADTVAAAHFLSPDDPAQVLLVGVCSGAYHAVEAAIELKSRAVWLLNPAVPVASSLRSATSRGAGRTKRRAVRRADPISRRLTQMDRPVDLAHRLMPEAGWWLLDKLGLYTYAIKALDPLLEQGTETYLVCGETEAVQYLDRGHRAFRHSLESGRLHFEKVATLDHAVMMAQSRGEVIRRLDDYVTDQLSAVTTAASH